MWLPRVVDLRFPILCLLIAADISMGSVNVNFSVPAAVKRGDNAVLTCNYDMLEGDVLYSVKWYKGKREFYRYTPKENPAMKVFQSSGIVVEPLQSNQSQVMLTAVQLNNSGKFKCEVSADAPSFQTTIVAKEMEVVELPREDPTITGIHTRYRPKDIIRGNCSSDYSKPAANLTWSINDVMVNSLSHGVGIQSNTIIQKYKNIKDLEKHLESSILGLHLVIQPHHFIRGKLKLRCVAQIYNLYDQSVDRIIEEDHPRYLATASGHSMNNILSGPYDPSNGDHGGDPDEYLSTQLKGDNVSLSSKPCSLSILLVILTCYILYRHS